MITPEEHEARQLIFRQEREARQLIVLQLIYLAGELTETLHPAAPDRFMVGMWAVQTYSTVNNRWMDAGTELYDDEEVAKERAQEILPWKHVNGRARVVFRVIWVKEEITAEYGVEQVG